MRIHKTSVFLQLVFSRFVPLVFITFEYSYLEILQTDYDIFLTYLTFLFVSIQK
jgi:hypothetical protein